MKASFFAFVISTAIKPFVLLMAFIMLLTSCYSYKQLPLSHRDSLKIDDKVKIEANGTFYEHAIIYDMNDSTITISQYDYQERSTELHTISLNDIKYLYTRQKDKKNTKSGLIGGVIVTAALIVYLLGPARLYQ